jgi:hypothetical protein
MDLSLSFFPDFLKAPGKHQPGVFSLMNQQYLRLQQVFQAIMISQL